MELNFGKNIRNLRKASDITQEALATALGVSSQSVSKWETGYGFPDITQLPAIANYFGVTIDELFSNNDEAKEAQKDEFHEKFYEFEFGSEDKISFAEKYCRKYPKDMFYLAYLCASISECIRAHGELYDKYMPTLHDSVETLLDSEYRQPALLHMIRACKEENVEKWLTKCAYNEDYTRRGMLINRYDCHGNNKLWHIHTALGKIENFSTLLDHRFPDAYGPEKKAEFHRSVLAVIESFGKGGNIPDGWLHLYAYKQLVLSACLFGCEKTEEAWREFESGMEKFKRWYSLPDEYRDLGGILFANLKIKKNGRFAIDEDGNEYKLFGLCCVMSDYDAFIHDFLTEPRWAWFNPARKDPRFTEAVAWAKTLFDAE